MEHLYFELYKCYQIITQSVHYEVFVIPGILTLALFIHNAIITIMGNNKHQEKNVRRFSLKFLKSLSNCHNLYLSGRVMTIAYVLVTGTYMLLGGAFYICFPLPKLCIEDVSFPLYWSRIVEKDL